MCIRDRFGNDLVQFADDAVSGNVEDGGVLVLVDGDDVLGVLHTGNVLDGTRDVYKRQPSHSQTSTGLPALFFALRISMVGTSLPFPFAQRPIVHSS